MQSPLFNFIMKHKLIILFLTLPTILFSQGVNNLWLMGYQSWAGYPFGGTDVNFINGSADTIFHARQMNFGTTTASISDTSGNLLFYTNGVYIANRFDSLMVNGDFLNPSFYTNDLANDTFGLDLTQSHIIIPMPGQDSIYYLFHCSMDSFNVNAAIYTRFVYYSKIDMTLDNGKGAVTDKNVVLFTDSITQGGFSACKHGNGRDWWIICHQNWSNRYFKFLVTPDSIYGPYTQNIGSIREGFSPTHVFSQDGAKYAFMDGNYDLDVYDFDRCSGMFSNFRHATINDGKYDGHVAFSPNGNLVYVTSVDRVYQYNLLNPILDSSQITVAVWDSTYDPASTLLAALFSMIRLAPDNKIYISTGNSTRYLHVINNPDSVGLACDLQQHAITLPSICSNSIPYHPNYFLGADLGSSCDTLTAINESIPILGEQIYVYPNPAENYFTVKHSLNENQSVQFILFNSTGKEILNKNIFSGSQTIDINNLSNGIYFWQANTSEGNISNGKLVILK